MQLCPPKVRSITRFRKLILHNLRKMSCLLLNPLTKSGKTRKQGWIAIHGFDVLLFCLRFLLGFDSLVFILGFFFSLRAESTISLEICSFELKEDLSKSRGLLKQENSVSLAELLKYLFYIPSKKSWDGEGSCRDTS